MGVMNTSGKWKKSQQQIWITKTQSKYKSKAKKTEISGNDIKASGSTLTSHTPQQAAASSRHNAVKRLSSSRHVLQTNDGSASVCNCVCVYTEGAVVWLLLPNWNRNHYNNRRTTTRKLERTSLLWQQEYERRRKAESGRPTWNTGNYGRPIPVCCGWVLEAAYDVRKRSESVRWHCAHICIIIPMPNVKSFQVNWLIMYGQQSS